MYRLFIRITLFLLCCWGALAYADDQTSNAKIPILAYHRFGPTVPDSMTTTISVFEAQLQWLKDNQYTVIPLRTAVNYLLGEGPPPPPKSVVITADDGHISQYTYMLPLVRKYNIPVTLFIYPSAISNASYAMTWQQINELKQTGLFDIQGHTYWHPNFKKDKKRLSPAEYEKFVNTQLIKSKTVLEKKTGGKIDLLAWPFGIYDDYLEEQAKKAGYIMAFSIDARHAKKADNVMAEPRYLMINAYGTKGLATILGGQAEGKGPKSE